MDEGHESAPAQLKKQIIIRYLTGLVCLLSVFILSAGSLRFWHGWVFTAVLFLPLGLMLIYLIQRDPDLLFRRMKLKEKEKPQKWFVAGAALMMTAAFLVPGFDYRYGWSEVPVWLAISSDLIVLWGLVIYFLVMKENSFASRVIEVEAGQKVIETGPYAYVRHPMYTGALLVYIFGPLALGSWWAALAVLPMPFLIVMRIFNEEKILRKRLPGYAEYLAKIKYRLIPGLW